MPGLAANCRFTDFKLGGDEHEHDTGTAVWTRRGCSKAGCAARSWLYDMCWVLQAVLGTHFALLLEMAPQHPRATLP
jgi:hypothetical protein